MVGWSKADLHHYVIAEDVLLWRPHGEVLPVHAELVCSLLGQIIGRYGYGLWLINAEHSVPVGHASRVLYARYFVQEHVRVAAGIFNASLPAITTGALTARGIQLKTAGEYSNRVCATEAEARSYLDEQRIGFQLVLRKLAGSSSGVAQDP